MRSYPYESPPPFPPILNSLAALLPEPPAAHHHPYGELSDDSVQLSPLDHDTSRLVPEQKQQHHVWIQGKLTPVRSVSAANLTLDRPDSMRANKRETMRNLETPRRRSMANADWPDDEAEGGLHGVDKVALRQSTQLRGYGIGGAGNIRRPTDVIHGPTKPNESLWTMCFSSRDTSLNDSRWSFRDLFSKRERKGKGRVDTAT